MKEVVTNDEAAKLEDRIEVLESAMKAVLVETNFISLGAARDYIMEVLEVGPYSQKRQRD